MSSPGCRAIWTDGLRFVHTSCGGHALVTDAPAAAGGAGTAPSPMELVLHALCGCMGVDLIGILAKMRQSVTGLEISATGERADTQPRVYTRIALHVVVSGHVDEDKFKRALDLSLESYCSVAAMLRGSAPIETTWEIRI
ncbi:MAG: OsmC family protein [Candidatus Krumholzibacteria bacterium]|nr:OsmC family protein [Candidatus Krumholzibacteria bacterium]